MNVQVHRHYGSQSMAAPLRRVLMRSAASAMRHAKAAEWHYGPGFDAARAAAQHEAFADLVAASGAEVEWLTDEDDQLADSVFTHDPSLMTDHGAVLRWASNPMVARRSAAITVYEVLAARFRLVLMSGVPPTVVRTTMLRWPDSTNR